MMPEHAVVAYTELNGTMFHGRMFHVLPGKANDKNNDDDEDRPGNFKKKKQQELRKTAGLTHNWNTLFLGSNAVVEVMSRTYGKSKEEVLDSSTGGSNAAVRLALGETQIVLEMKNFLESNGVKLEAFDDENSKRSKTIILAKNLPAMTEVNELRERFAEFGIIEKMLLPPSGITCLIKFEQPSEARKAFRRLAYSKFKHLPLYLEWAPENTFKQDSIEENEKTEVLKEGKELQETPESDSNAVDLVEDNDDDDEDDTPPEPNTTLFIKNLNFETTEATVRDNFKHLGAIHVIQIAKKRSPENPQLQVPLGYGFIQFKMASSTEKALRTMQFCVIDDKQIELKRSDRTVQGQAEKKQSSKKKEQKTSTKIMVRNIPFQANTNEIKDLFKTFGELKAVRLPKKMASDQHRGFGFIDFVNKSDAKNAFEAIHHSTHLYGRRLVLEWAEADQDVDEIRKRTAEQMGSEVEPKKRRKALLKDEDFIKFASENEEDA
jgi:multiple RNA-binding domain-containing protein 1